MSRMTIGGKPADTLATFDVVNPATGQVEAQAPAATPDQVNEAMRSAANAFHTSWRHDEGARRQALRDIADAIEKSKAELDRLLILESGKPAWLAAAENESAPMWWRYYADLDIPREIIQDDQTALVEVAYRPLGVVSAITPWNGPTGLAGWKIAPALRTGNTVVLKPSPFTPLSTLLLGEIINDIVPPGVVNVISGGDDVGAALTTHSIPRKVSFTGSTEAGRHIAAACARDFKRVDLEMGGNDAAILLDDVDIDQVVRALAPITLMNNGQICVIPKRVFAPAKIYAQVVDAFAAAYDEFVLGAPHDEGTQLGPLSTKPQFDRVSELVEDAKTNGARVVTGGYALDRPGFFYKPTILADVTEGVRVVDEEQFGPVLPILSYDTVEEAVARANNTNYGLSGSVWSADGDRANAVAEQLEVGTAYVNAHAILPPHIPFTGAKSSGVGVANGLPGMLAYTEPQTVHRPRS